MAPGSPESLLELKGSCYVRKPMQSLAMSGPLGFFWAPRSLNNAHIAGAQSLPCRRRPACTAAGLVTMEQGGFLEDQTTREQDDLTSRVLEIYAPYCKLTEASAGVASHRDFGAIAPLFGCCCV